MNTLLNLHDFIGESIHGLSILMDTAIKSVLLLAVASGIVLLVRKKSPALRHMVWFSALIGLLCLPILSVTLPALRVAVLPEPPAEMAPATPTNDAAGTAATPAGPSIPQWHEPHVVPWLLDQQFRSGAEFSGNGPPVDVAALAEIADVKMPPSHELPSWPVWAAAAWLTGATITGGWWLLSYFAVRRIVRKAEIVADPQWQSMLANGVEHLGIGRTVLLVRSERAHMPMTVGWVRPVVLVPDSADAWSMDRRRVVLLHELAHIKRFDCLTLALGHFASAFYWFNPLTWFALRRMRVECELACDDAVLAAGPKASDYAEHLLVIAQTLRSPRYAGAAGIAMARPAHLEGRLLAILDATRDRRGASRLWVLASMILSILLLLPLASVHLTQGVSESVASAEEIVLEPMSPAEQAAVSPQKAVMLDTHLMWTPRHWSGPVNTEIAWHDEQREFPMFSVGDPGMCKVWTRYLDLPVDPKKYPFVVVEYRARNIHPTAGTYVLWLDDETGPDHGGMVPFGADDLIADDKVHVLRFDMRTKNPKGQIIGMALGVHVGNDLPAEFELFSLRYEASDDSVPVDPPADDAAVTVNVLDAQTDQPLADARVTVDAERINFARSGNTDAAGTASIVPLVNESGKHMVRVEKSGYVTIELKEIKADGEAPVVRLDPATTFKGMVKNEDGQPIQGAAVGLLVQRAADNRTQRIPYIPMAATDENGHWQSPPVPKGSTASLRINHPEYTRDPVFGSNYRADNLEDGSAVLVMKRGTVVSGRITDDQGKPVSAATVKQGADRWGSSYPSMVTGADGQFVFAGSSPGMMVLTVQAPGFAPDLKTVQVGNQPMTVDFQLAKSQPVTGRVVDANGKPIAGATIGADGWRGNRSIDWSSLTNDKGEFTWADAPGDEVECYLYAEGFMREEPMLSPAKSPMTITLRPVQRITGRVTDAETGKPIETFAAIPGLDFRGSGERATHWERRNAKPTTQPGVYQMDITRTDCDHSVRIEADGYKPAISRKFTPDEGSHTFDFQLEKGKMVAGVIRSADGGPLPGAKIILATPGHNAYIRNGKDINDQGCPMLTTRADGRYQFPAQVEPFVLVVIHDQGYAEITEAQAAQGNGDITLQPWGNVSGTVLIGKKPGANQGVVLHRRDEQYDPKQPRVYHDIQTTANTAGDFTFDRVPAGKLTVARSIRTDMGGGRGMVSYSHSTPVEVEPGKTVSVQIGGKGRPVIGRVVLPEDTDTNFVYGSSSISTKIEYPKPPVPDNLSPEEKKKWYTDWQQTDVGKAFVAKQQELSASRKHYPVQMQADGAFRIDDVEAGTYQLRVSLNQPPVANQCGYGEDIGQATQEFTVPEIPGGQSDEPLELASVEVKLLKRIGVGQPAPLFTAAGLDGKEIKLADYQGKYALLDFWATWCGPCVAETPNLKAVYGAYGSDPRFAMIALSLDPDQKDPKAYVEKNDLKWTQGFLGEWSKTLVPSEYGVRGIPSIWLIGPDGKVVAKDLRGPNIKLAIEQALGKK